MVSKRIMTAAVGIPVVVYIVAFCGTAVFFLFILSPIRFINNESYDCKSKNILII